MKETLFAGVGEACITPPVGTPMMGFSDRDHGCEGVHDDLYAKALALKQGRRKLVLVALDLGSLDREGTQGIKRELKERYGLPPKNVLLACSHTHAGPVAAERSYAEAPDPGYMASLREKISQAVGDALGDLKPARLSFGLGSTEIGVCRRLKTPEGVVMAPNPEGDVDRDLPVMFLSELSGKPIALLFSASCHPTTMKADNYLISAEWPGAARRILEEHVGAPALFLQGAGADVKPRIVGDGEFRSGRFEDVEAVGKEVAEDVLGVLEGGLREVEPRLCSALLDASLPLEKPLSRTELERLASDPDVSPPRRRWAGETLALLEERGRLPRRTRCFVHFVCLGEDTRIVGLEGEPCTGIGKRIKALFGDRGTVVVGYCNGSVAYLPTRRILEEGGYEAESYVYFGLPSRFAPGVEDKLAEAAMKAAERCGWAHV